MYPRIANIEGMKTAAESGDPKAALNLGWCYYIGNGVVQSKADALKWYATAANAGVPEAKEILHILETEAQRDSELKALKLEANPSPRRRSAAWLVIISVILTSIGSIAMVLHIFEGQFDMREPGAVEGGNTAKEGGALRTANQSPGSAQGRMNLGQAEAGPEDLKTASVAAPGRGGIQTEHGTAEPVVAAESRTQVSQPTDPRRSSGSLTDFNAVAERAMKWRDGDDVPGTNEPVKGTDQKRGQE